MFIWSPYTTENGEPCFCDGDQHPASRAAYQMYVYCRVMCPKFGHPALTSHSGYTNFVDAVDMLRK